MSAGETTARRVAVVGAGLAGLRAAWQLVHRGFDVVVYEARAQIGGRAAGEWRAGHWMDSAWPVLDARNATLLHFAAQLGLADELLPLRPVQVKAWHGGRAEPIEPTSLRGAAWIPGWPILQTPKLLRWGRLMTRYAPLLDPRAPEKAAPLDYRSVRDHVELYFGRAALDLWLTPELQTSLGDRVEDLSRAALLHFVRARGLGAARPGLSGLPRRPLAELAEAVAEHLPVYRGTRVARIDAAPAGGYRIESTDPDGSRHEAVFDAVIVTTAAREAVNLVGPHLTVAELDFFAAVRERAVVCVVLAVSGVEAGVPHEIRFARRESTPLAACLVVPGQALGRAPEGQSQIVALVRDAASATAFEEPDDVVSKTVLRALARVWPAIDERVLDLRVARTQTPFFEVGSFRRLARFVDVQRDRRALGRRLYFAGDLYAGAGFEAALRSGDRVSAELASDFA